LSAASLRDHQLLIILRDGVNWPNGHESPPVQWMTDEQQQAVWDFVNISGGGFLALHNAHGRYPEGGPYYSLLGCDSGSHPPPYVFTIRIEDRGHQITEGVEDFEIFDEQHIMKYNLDRKQVLMRSMAKDSLTSEAGWWQEVGRGRFCYFAPGHTPEALGHPMMQRLLRNSFGWLLRY
jgi:type 1 glutamine amidotransferase